MSTINLPLLNDRTCGTCTKCCEGWLTANIYGHEMLPGQPCFFVEQNVGCKIYNTRPTEPCKTFSCGWKQIPDLPEEFKPEISGVIMHYKNNINKYWVLTKAPNNPSVEFLSWAITFAMANGENLLWSIDNQMWWIGSQEFCLEMKGIYK